MLFINKIVPYLTNKFTFICVALLTFSCIALGQPGSLDLSFNGSGFARTGFGNGSSVGYATAVQPDGKILVAGSGQEGTDGGFLLVRYMSDGALDNTFSSDGSSFMRIGSTSSKAIDLALQGDGKIVVIGTVLTGTAATGFSWNFAIARYNVDGSLDETFGNHGIVITDIAPGSDQPYAVAIQTDGRIVVVGSASGQNKTAIVRYQNNGALDNSFNGSGIILTAAYSGFSLLIQNDGKILVGGTSGNGNSTDFSLARHNSDGSPDLSFDVDGIVATNVGNSSDYGMALAIRPDNKIVLAGKSWVNGRDILSMAQYNSNGSLDTTFDNDGKLLLNESPTYIESIDIAVQQDSKLVFTLNTIDHTRGIFVGGRINFDGSVDTSFGQNGLAFSPFIGNFATNKSIALDVDGKIVTCGHQEYGLTVYKLDTNGDPDSSFDSDGIVTTELGNASSGAQSVAMQPDGKIVVAGYGSVDFLLARYNSDGTMDESFGVGGKVQSGLANVAEKAYAVAVQKDGKIIAAGVGNNKSVLYRYAPDGSLDNTFGVEGRVETAFNSIIFEGSAIVLQPDGKLIVVVLADRHLAFLIS